MGRRTSRGTAFALAALTPLMASGSELLAAPAPAAAPPTAAEPVRESVHGVEIVDPYRWLEGSAAPELAAPDRDLDERVAVWTDAQNAYTRSVLDGLPGRDQLVTAPGEYDALDQRIDGRVLDAHIVARAFRIGGLRAPQVALLVPWRQRLRPGGDDDVEEQNGRVHHPADREQAEHRSVHGGGQRRIDRHATDRACDEERRGKRVRGSLPGGDPADAERVGEHEKRHRGGGRREP